MLWITPMEQARAGSPGVTSGPGSRHEQPLFWAVAAALCVISLGLHFWKIGSAPPGFYIDESSTAYNAYCILQTGADEHGNPYPAFFRFGSQYQDPVLVYALVPFVQFLGLHVWVARIPSALFHLLASAAFALLVQIHCRNKWLSLFGGFLFSVIPWVFPVSRTATGAYTGVLLGMVSGWYLMLRAMERQSVGCAVAAGAGWALAMYAYHAGRPMSVLLLVCLALAFYDSIVSRWKIWAALCGSCLAVLTPLIVSVIRSPHVLTARFEATSVFQDHPSLGEAVARIASRYVEYFTPHFLFFAGDPNLRHHTGFGGELFIFLIPLILAGLFCIARSWRDEPRYRFIGLGILAYPAAAVLTLDHSHSMRCINGAVFWLLTAAIGARYLWEGRPTGRNLLLVVCCLGLAEIGLYVKDYFGQYQVRSRNDFQAAFTEVLEDCFGALGPGETLYISVTAFAPLKLVPDKDFNPYYYVDILFFGRIDPRVYQHGGIPKDRVRPYEGVIRNPGLFLRCNMRLETPLIAGQPPSYTASLETIPAGAELSETKSLGGIAQYEVYRVK
jgi:hypothetical protein